MKKMLLLLLATACSAVSIALAVEQSEQFTSELKVKSYQESIYVAQAAAVQEVDQLVQTSANEEEPKNEVEEPEEDPLSNQPQSEAEEVSSSLSKVAIPKQEPKVSSGSSASGSGSGDSGSDSNNSNSTGGGESTQSAGGKQISATITYYCACSKCCGKGSKIDADGNAYSTSASGMVLYNGRSNGNVCAANFGNLGDKIVIRGTTYTIVDRFGSNGGNYKVDIFTPAGHAECLRLGRQTGVTVTLS